jgi:hypothetical protein
LVVNADQDDLAEFQTFGAVHGEQRRCRPGPGIVAGDDVRGYATISESTLNKIAGSGCWLPVRSHGMRHVDVRHR